MRVFVTGASGHIGSVVAAELIAAGHEVLGLARSDASARALTAVGVGVHRGDLASPETLRAAAVQCDGVIHLAFNHNFETGGWERAMAEETAAVEAFAAALEGTGKPLVFTSGTPTAPGRAATEEDPPLTVGPLGVRGRNAQAVLSLAARGVRSAIVRLPRSVHEAHKQCGFASVIVGAARSTGVAGYVGDGSQRWPAVHRLDAARLFRLVLEHAEPGTVAHAVADEGDMMRSIAEVIGRTLGLPTKPVPPETFGFLGGVFANDQPASSALTRAKFDWQPTHPNLITDLEAGDYPA